MTDTYWLESDSTRRLLPLRDAEELWSLGPVEIDREAVLAVVDGPGWRAKWRAKQLQPCAAPGEKPWRVTRITVDEDAAPMDRASLGLTGDVCKLIRQGRHLRLEDRPQSGVNLEDAGGFDSFEGRTCRCLPLGATDGSPQPPKDLRHAVRTARSSPLGLVGPSLFSLLPLLAQATGGGSGQSYIHRVAA